MAYIFANQKEVTELNLWCLEVIHDVQKILKKYFTFDIRLIGSGEKRLVTKSEDENFDLDYNLILQKDKCDLLNNPGKIKELFINAFNSVLERRVNGYKSIQDSSSVVKVSLNYNRKSFSFDVALYVKADDDKYYRIIKDNNRYIWNQVRDSKNYLERYLYIKQEGYFQEFRKRYLELKNMHFKNRDKVKSFSIFLETLNEFEQND